MLEREESTREESEGEETISERSVLAIAVVLEGDSEPGVLSES